MTDNDKILTVVHEWTAKAENDLKNAVHTLKMAAAGGKSFAVNN